jgi:uroporphyrinogen-III synthase
MAGVARAKDIEAQLQRAESELRLLQKISRMFAKSPPLGEALQQVARMVSGFMHGDSCLVYLVSGAELVLCAADGPNPGAVGDVRLRLSEGLTGWVARERRMVAISREAYQDPRFKYFRDLPEDAYEAFLSAPVIARNRVVGVINVQHRQPHAHSGEELEVITTVGEQVGGLVAMSCIDPAGLGEVDFADIALGRMLARRA